jgi:hypothetical protein
VVLCGENRTNSKYDHKPAPPPRNSDQYWKLKKFKDKSLPAKSLQLFNLEGEGEGKGEGGGAGGGAGRERDRIRHKNVHIENVHCLHE